MGVRAGGIFAAVLMFLGGPAAAGALATGPVGADPASNFTIGALPRACQTDPTGGVCIDASVSYLDQARASLGQPPYALPADFASLSPIEQALILTDSDRELYGLPPITGLTDGLDQDAAAGAMSDRDPVPSTSDWYGYTSNAAWGDANMVLAYEGWMYDDGPGSDNIDCTASDPSGCWGHRHDILWQFDPGTLAMGAASGTDARGNPSYTLLLIQGAPGFAPAWMYTWAQALADGAGGPSGTTPTGSGSGPPPTSAPAGGGPAPGPVARDARVAIRILRVRVHGHRVTVRIAAARGASFRCSLSRRHARFRRSKLCTRVVSFTRVPHGRYRLRIRSAAGTLSRRILVG